MPWVNHAMGQPCHGARVRIGLALSVVQQSSKTSLSPDLPPHAAHMARSRHMSAAKLKRESLTRPFIKAQCKPILQESPGCPLAYPQVSPARLSSRAPPVRPLLFTPRLTEAAPGDASQQATHSATAASCARLRCRQRARSAGGAADAPNAALLTWPQAALAAVLRRD